MDTNSSAIALATFGTGCFWCTEAIFQQLKGVQKVVPGYMGGHVATPSYEQVCTGTTGHAECLLITFDPAIVSYEDLLEVFWFPHDPTQLNGQGNDIGPQYRSAIFYHSEEQRVIAVEFRLELEKQSAYPKPIVTEITAASVFYLAEDYHLNYFNKHVSDPYCSFVIRPKLQKVKKIFPDRIASSGQS